MFFSIIIPMYNVEKYIGECIDSLLCQSMSDFEIVIVDDGSKDKSAEIAKRYTEKDSRVVLLRKENGGQSTARNFGLRHAKGEYIIFIDSDDFVSKDDYLEELHKKIEESKADVVMYRYNKYYEHREPQFERCGYSFSEVMNITDTAKLIPELVKRDAYYASAWTKTIRRSLLAHNGIEFDETLRCEDVDWSYRIMEKAERIALVDREFIAYRQREGSVTNAGSLINMESLLITLEKYKKRYEDPATDIDEGLRRGLLGSLAKLYSNLYLSYGRVKDKKKKQFLKRIKALSSLFKYAESKRPRLIGTFHRVFGLRLTLLAVGIIDKING